jgi:hypothetical protein
MMATIVKGNVVKQAVAINANVCAQIQPGINVALRQLGLDLRTEKPHPDLDKIQI